MLFRNYLCTLCITKLVEIASKNVSLLIFGELGEVL